MSGDRRAKYLKVWQNVRFCPCCRSFLERVKKMLKSGMGAGWVGGSVGPVGLVGRVGRVRRRVQPMRQRVQGGMVGGRAFGGAGLAARQRFCQRFRQGRTRLTGPTRPTRPTEPPGQKPPNFVLTLFNHTFLPLDLHMSGIVPNFAPVNETSRDGAVVARWAHNPKVGGSSPPPATKSGGFANKAEPLTFCICRNYVINLRVCPARMAWPRHGMQRRKAA